MPLTRIRADRSTRDRAERVTVAFAESPFEIAPHVTLRFNQLPYTPFTTPEQTGAIASRLARLHELTTWRRDQRAQICEALYRLGQRTPADLLTSVLLPLKRDIHNDRVTRVPFDVAGRVTADPRIARWYDVQRELGQIESEIDAWYAEAADAERQRLQQRCADAAFLQALTVSSRSAYDAAHAYVSTPVAMHTSKIRRTEHNILQYVTRAMTRTTPFSLYTSIGVGRWSSTGIDAYPFEVDGPLVSAAVPDHSLVRRFLDAVAGHPAAARLMSYKTCADYRVAGDALLFDIHTDDPVKQPRVFKTALRQGAVKLTPAVRAILGWMRNSGSPVKPYTAIVDALETSFGSGSRDRAAAFVDQLIHSGLLVVDVPIAEHTDRILADAVAWLATKPSPLCQSLAATIQGIDDTLTGFDRAVAPSRASRMKQIETGWHTAFSALDAKQPDSVTVYEDSVAREPIPLRPARWGQALDDLKRLVNVVEIFDTKPVLKAVVCDEFAKRYGAGGRCDDVREFATLIPGIYARLFKAWIHDPSEPIHRTNPTLAAIGELRRRFLTALNEHAASGAPEAQLDASLLDDIAGAIPDSFRRDWASFSVFAQPAVVSGSIERLVINQIYGGLGVFMTRFLPLLGSDVLDELRAQIRSFFPADYMVAELRPVAGFNGNLHAPLTDFDIDGDRGPGATIDSADLRFHHDAGSNSIAITHAGTGRRVVPLYLGVMVPFLLPDRQRLLYSLSGSGQVNVAFHLLAERALDDDARARVRRYPRIGFGKVVLHRTRWYVPRAAIPQQGPQESDARYLTRLNIWRLDEALPETAFFHEQPQRSIYEHATDSEEWRQRFSWTRSKPQFIDFRSGLFVRYFAKWLRTADPDSDVYLEEVLPEFSQSVCRSGSQPRVMETLVELNRRALDWDA